MDVIENTQIPEPTQPVQQVPVEPKKKSKLPVIVILVIAILLVGIGGVYAGMQLSKKQTSVVVIPTAPPQEIRPTEALLTSTSDETANWKTYTNEKYGFEFKYPINKVADFQKTPYNGFCNDNKRQGLVNLQLYPSGTELPVGRELESTDVSFFVYGEINSENLSIDQWITKNCSQVLSGYQVDNITIAGLPAIKYTRTGEGMGSGDIQPYIFLSKNNSIFYIHPYGDKTTFDLILSTFKFTD